MMTGMKCAAFAGVLVLTAGSAVWAQNYNPNQNYTPNTGMQGGYNQGVQSGLGRSAPGGSVSPDMQQKIRQMFEQSGFKDIRVVPEAFVVHAQAPDGSHVVMLLSPTEVAEVAIGGNQGPGGSQPYGAQPSGQAATQQQAQQELSRYGYSDLRDLRPMRGWTADATKNGQNVRVLLSDNGLVATFQGR
jgi:hypothetical protein